MNKKIIANIDFCEVKHFAAPKRGGAIIRGGAIFRGNTVHLILDSVTQKETL